MLRPRPHPRALLLAALLLATAATAGVELQLAGATLADEPRTWTAWNDRTLAVCDGGLKLVDWNALVGARAEDVQVTHQFAESGVYEVFLTAVDEEGAEGKTNGFVTVAGAKSLDPTFTIHEFTVSECAACEPENYPPAGAPADLDWETARGFRIVATAGTSSSRAIQATFSEPLPDDFLLYALPTWDPIAFTLVNEYTGSALALYHIDLYRIVDVKAAHTFGLDDYLYGDGVCTIEWAERVRDLWPDEYLLVNLRHIDDTKRGLTMRGMGDGYRALVQRFRQSAFGV